MGDSDPRDDPRPAAIDAAERVGEVSGKDYLEAAVALAWFRAEYPHGDIVTEELEDGELELPVLKNPKKPTDGTVLLIGRRAKYRCQITTPDGGGATAYATESSLDFLDYVEKAEKKAIRRALENLGYSLGTLKRMGLLDPPEAPRPHTSTNQPPANAPKPATSAAPAAAGSDQATNAPAVPERQLLEWRDIVDQAHQDGPSARPGLFDQAGQLSWRWVEIVRRATKVDQVNAALTASRKAGVRDGNLSSEASARVRAIAGANTQES